MKKDTMIFEGKILECLPGTKFKVKVNDKIIIGHLSGKIRKNYIKIIAGDLVKIEISPYDLTKGRIIYREKGR